jgi:hypothetical protein
MDLGVADTRKCRQCWICEGMLSGAVLFPYSFPYWCSDMIPETPQSPRTSGLHSFINPALNIWVGFQLLEQPFEKLRGNL